MLNFLWCRPELCNNLSFMSTMLNKFYAFSQQEVVEAQSMTKKLYKYTPEGTCVCSLVKGNELLRATSFYEVFVPSEKT